MLETSARLLRLLSLLGSRRFWSGAELADRLEVTQRTVRRDIDKLRSLGYPVSSSTGAAGGYQLTAGAKLPPLLLEEDEALAMALGLCSAAAGSVAGMESIAVRALAKLDQVLPTRLRRRMKAIHTAVVPMHIAAPSVDLDALTTLASACRDEEIVTFRYEDREGRTSDRCVEPHGLVHAGSRWYLAAWDISREDFRTFRVDRVKRARSDERRFRRRELPHGDVAAYVSHSVAAAGYDVRLQVVLLAPYEDMARRVSPLAARLQPLDSGRCLLEAGGSSLEMLALHIALLGVDFEILEPPELAEPLALLARRLTRAARAARAPKRARRSARS